MTAAADEREQAVAATETTCPRCGAAREPDQEYCLECGLRLPTVRGRLPGLRRRWIRRLGWYPGDWVWAALGALVVAAAGGAAAVALTLHRHPSHGSVITATSSVPVVEPTAVPTAPATASTVGSLPTAPEPRARHAPRNGRLVWPAHTSGWTIVLVSYPKARGLPAARATALQAAKAGVPQAGVLDSSRYPSLQPGYYVVFSGIYASQADANASVATVHQAGFGGAYSRQISR